MLLEVGYCCYYYCIKNFGIISTVATPINTTTISVVEVEHCVLDGWEGDGCDYYVAVIGIAIIIMGFVVVVAVLIIVIFDAYLDVDDVVVNDGIVVSDYRDNWVGGFVDIGGCCEGGYFEGRERVVMFIIIIEDVVMDSFNVFDMVVYEDVIGYSIYAVIIKDTIMIIAVVSVAVVIIMIGFQREVENNLIISQFT